MSFQKATRKKARARVGIVGPAGSGKTYSALQIAFGMGGKIAVIDTENGSADLYASLGDYDVAPITPPFSVKKYLDLIHEAEKSYDIIIIDSLSHAWAGTGGLLEEVDKRAGSGNKFAAWRDVTPMHNSLIDAMLQSPAHIIATMRSKTEYVIEENDKGKKVPRKIGMAPVQREGMDYEFTVVFDVDQDRHVARPSKDRTSLFDGQCDILTRGHGEQLRAWLDNGVDAPIIPRVDTSSDSSQGTVSKAQADLLAELGTACKGDEAEMKLLLATVSHYEKDGKSGELSLADLKKKSDSAPFQRWVGSALGKLRDRAKTPTICNECREPLDASGTCRNSTCPDVKVAEG